MVHLIITPVFNEEDHLDTFINSVIDQKIKPKKFILVDDSSTDNSTSIIKSYAKKYKWIEYVYHPAEMKKSQGAKVVRAFNYGLNQVSLNNVDVISKIDADLELPPNYFSEIITAFQDKNIGLAGGYILEKDEDQWYKIPQASYHIRGALKSYRVETFREIDGLMPVLGWDGLDEMKAFHKGWKSKIVDVGVKHYRPASNDYNKADLAYKKGLVNYKNGGNLFLALIRTIVKMKKKPYIMVGISFLQGYLTAYFGGEKRIVDSNLARFINKFHLRRLLSLNRY